MDATLQPTRRIISRLLQEDARFFGEHHYLNPPVGCREELLDPPDLGSTAAADRDVFWKSDRVFRFFPSGGSL
jgi:hypothetical protein